MIKKELCDKCPKFIYLRPNEGYTVRVCTIKLAEGLNGRARVCWAHSKIIDHVVRYPKEIPLKCPYLLEHTLHAELYLSDGAKI